MLDGAARGNRTPKDFVHSILSAARLPIPPWSHFLFDNKIFFIFLQQVIWISTNFMIK